MAEESADREPEDGKTSVEAGSGPHVRQVLRYRWQSLLGQLEAEGELPALAAAMRTNPAPTIDDVKQAVAGNICRCGTYPHVFKAALAAARTAGIKPPGVV